MRPEEPLAERRRQPGWALVCLAREVLAAVDRETPPWHPHVARHVAHRPQPSDAGPLAHLVWPVLVQQRLEVLGRGGRPAVEDHVETGGARHVGLCDGPLDRHFEPEPEVTLKLARQGIEPARSMKTAPLGIHYAARPV